MGITIGEIIKRALDESEEILINSINRNLMEISKSTKRKHGFLKVAVTDEICDSMFSHNRSPIGLMVFIDRDVWERLQDIDPTAIPSEAEADRKEV